MSGGEVSIRQATPKDLQGIVELLVAARLPTTGVEANLTNFLVAESADNDVIAVIGMECSGSFGLLRSLAVTPVFQKRGVARQLVTEAINKAQAGGMSDLYLLTETAAKYLARFGFTQIYRSEIPIELLNNSALNSACSCASTCMILKLNKLKIL